MKRIPFNKNIKNKDRTVRVPVSLINAMSSGTNIMKTEVDMTCDSAYVESDSNTPECVRNDLYLYDITNILLKKLGEICTHHLTDFLIDWDRILSEIKLTSYGCRFLGFREMGVDSNCYIMNSLITNRYEPEKIFDRYKKIYAVMWYKIKTEDPHIPDRLICCLKDIDHITYDETDEDMNYDDEFVPIASEHMIKKIWEDGEVY